MRGYKNWLKTGVLGAVVAAGALAVTTQSAFAYVVCNKWNDCWRVAARPTYPANVKVKIYPDTWRAAHTGPRYHWRADRDDRGYYDHGVWRVY
jgi:hypothetical protein